MKKIAQLTELILFILAIAFAVWEYYNPGAYAYVPTAIILVLEIILMKWFFGKANQRQKKYIDHANELLEYTAARNPLLRDFQLIGKENKRAYEKHGIQDWPSVAPVKYPNNVSVHYGIPFEDIARNTCDKRIAEGSCTWADIALEELVEAINEKDHEKRILEIHQLASVCFSWLNSIRRNELKAKPAVEIKPIHPENKKEITGNTSNEHLATDFKGLEIHRNEKLEETPAMLKDIDYEVSKGLEEDKAYSSDEPENEKT